MDALRAMPHANAQADLHAVIKKGASGDLKLSPVLNLLGAA